MLWIIDAISIIFALLLGVITTTEDLRENKIRNKWVFTALALALILQLFRIILTLRLGYAINMEYYKHFIVNIVITLVLGILLWELNLWSPADAKLLVAYSALLPLSIYSHGYLDYFPSFVLLVNSFTPACIYFLGKIIICTPKTTKIKALKKTLKPASILKLALLVFGFSWIISLIFSQLSMPSNIGTTILILFFTMMIIEKTRTQKLIYVAAIARIILDPNILNLNFLSQFLITIIILLILIYLTEELSFKSITRLVSASYVKPGMLAMINGAVLEVTEQNIDSIKSSKIRIRVLEMIPFAPLLFAGVLLTIICKGNFLVALRAIIG